MIKPCTFFINVTNKCNLNCIHCYALKDNVDMTPEVLNLANEYVVEQINDSNEEEYVVNYTGGEVGIYSQKAILDSIHYIKEHCKGKVVKFIYQSNFVYSLTPEHMVVLNEMDEIATSYDIDTNRFKSHSTKIMWMNNIRFIKQKYPNTPFRLSLVATQGMVNTEPSVILDLVMALDIHILEVNSMQSNIMSGNTPKYNQLLPNTDVLRDWLYRLFKVYEEIHQGTYYELVLTDFECLRDSFENNNYWVYSRDCCLRNRTISADGKLSTCLMTQLKPIYDLVTKTELNSLEEWCKCETALPEICNNCEYLKYCKGGCQFYQFDEYGCATPTKIYDYLELQKELRDNVE